MPGGQSKNKGSWHERECPIDFLSIILSISGFFFCSFILFGFQIQLAGFNRIGAMLIETLNMFSSCSRPSEEQWRRDRNKKKNGFCHSCMDHCDALLIAYQGLRLVCRLCFGVLALLSCIFVLASNCNPLLIQTHSTSFRFNGLSLIKNDRQGYYLHLFFFFFFFFVYFFFFLFFVFFLLFFFFFFFFVFFFFFFFFFFISLFLWPIVTWLLQKILPNTFYLSSIQPSLTLLRLDWNTFIFDFFITISISIAVVQNDECKMILIHLP